MTAPTPDEIACVLAAPEPVRHALAAIPGPGWAVSPTGNALLQPDPEYVSESQRWLPADPTAICGAVARLSHEQGRASHWGGPAPWLLESDVEEDDSDVVIAVLLDVAGCRAPTARLAALKLLAEVLRG
jgi:hypothetical protein